MKIFRQNIKNSFQIFLQDERGATAIEYVLIAAFLSLAIAVSVGIVGGTLDTQYFQAVSDSF